MELHELTICPEPTCRMVAEIVDRITLGSTDGPIEHIKTYCVERHVFLLPTDLGTELGNQIERFAIEPSDNVKAEMISTLEGMRKEAEAENAFIKW